MLHADIAQKLSDKRHHYLKKRTQSEKSDSQPSSEAEDVILVERVSTTVLLIFNVYKSTQPRGKSLKKTRSWEFYFVKFNIDFVVRYLLRKLSSFKLYILGYK